MYLSLNQIRCDSPYLQPYISLYKFFQSDNGNQNGLEPIDISIIYELKKVSCSASPTVKLFKLVVQVGLKSNSLALSARWN